METTYNTGAARIRADYSRHILRATLQGFAPLSLRQFVATLAAVSI